MKFKTKYAPDANLVIVWSEGDSAADDAVLWVPPAQLDDLIDILIHEQWLLQQKGVLPK